MKKVTKEHTLKAWKKCGYNAAYETVKANWAKAPESPPPSDVVQEQPHRFLDEKFLTQMFLKRTVFGANVF